MCSFSASAAQEKVLAALEAAESPRTGRQLLEAFALETPVCESHLLFAIQRLHRDGKVRIPGRGAPGELSSGELLSLGFVSSAKPWILNDRWKILEPIGEGGMSRVYKAEQLTLGGRFVAVKITSVAHLDPSVREEVRKRGEREARILAGLSHPNIVEIYDGGTEGDQWYSVMKYLSGGTLGDLMKSQGGRVGWRKALAIAIDLADALARAAAKGVLHRDIKPENVMFDDQGIVRITDFGLAKPTATFTGQTVATESLTRVEAVRGSLEWMAPERWEGIEPPEGSEAADIYSFGMMLRLVLTGSHPFPFPTGGGRLLQWHKHHVDTVPKPLVEEIPDCNREFAESVDRMIRKRPEDRYRSFQKIAAELRRIASRLPRPTTTVIGRPATTIARPRTRISEVRHDTALADFLNLLEIDIAKLDHALQEQYGDLGTNPDLLRALWELARAKKAVPFAAAMWAEAEPGRKASDFEAAYSLSLEAFSRGGESSEFDPALPLDLCRLLWMGFRKIERERRESGAWGDTTALEGLLEFLMFAASDPALQAFRVTVPPPVTPAATAEVAPTAPLIEADPLPEAKPSSRSRMLVPVPVRPPAEAAAAEPDSLIGKTIDNYNISEKIGEGGMGTVYLAHDLTLDRPVALKILHDRFAKEPTFQERFIREARLAAKLTHPNLVAVQRAGDDQGYLWYVMEYVPSRTTLADHLERRDRMDLAEILRTGLETAMGLHAIHSQGWVHRDIKPDNLMVIPGPDGKVDHVKILDAGLLRLVDDPKSITTDKLFVGTPEYASPEQMKEQSVDGRSDLYGLGIILYECLAGGKDARPYPAKSKTTFVLKTVDPATSPTPLRDKNPEVPLEVATLVHQLLEKDPAHRIASAAELVTTLEGLLARALSGALAPVKVTMGRKAVLLTAALGLAALVSTAAVVFRSRPGKEALPPQSFQIGRTPELTGASKTSAPHDDHPAEPPAAKEISKEPAAAAGKMPELRLPSAEEIPPSPPKAPSSKSVLVGHAAQKRELELLDELLELSRASLPQRSAYELQEALARVLAWRASKLADLTPWVTALADAEVERLGAGFQAFKTRPLLPAGSVEADLVLRSGGTLHGKIVAQDAGEITIEPEGALREAVSLKRIAPITFPSSNVAGLQGILVRSAAGDALGCLPKLAELSEEDRLRLRPILVDQAIEELLLAAGTDEGLRMLSATPIPEADRSSIDATLPKRLRLLQVEREAALLYAKRPSQEVETKLLTEYPGTRAAAAVAREALATFRKALTGGAEIARIQVWANWNRGKCSDPLRCSFTLDPGSEDYRLEAPASGDWAWAWRDHEGSKSGYVIDWSFAPLSPQAARLWLLPCERIRVEIGRSDVVIKKLDGDPGSEKERVLLSRDHAPLSKGKLSVVPRNGVPLLFVDEVFVSALPKPDSGLPGRVEIGVSSGSLLIHSVLVADPNAR